MNTIHRDIFKAIHEGKWMTIEYKNWQGQITRYWIGILNLDAARKTLKVEGLHLGKCRCRDRKSTRLNSSHT